MGPSVTLSSTVRCGNRLKRWNTMAVLARASCVMRSRSRFAGIAAPGGRENTSRPSISIRPLSGISSRFMQRNSVLLPEPLGPMMAITSPRPTSTSTPHSARWEPKLFVTPRSRTIGATRSGITTRGQAFEMADDKRAWIAQNEVECRDHQIDVHGPESDGNTQLRSPHQLDHRDRRDERGVLQHRDEVIAHWGQDHARRLRNYDVTHQRRAGESDRQPGFPLSLVY